MQTKQFKFIVLLALCFSLMELKAQDAIPVSGSNASGNGASVSYSIGQIFYSSISGTNGFLIQGIQQPYEISVISGMFEMSGIDFMLETYPNPTADFLILRINALSNFDVYSLTYALFDVNGKLLDEKKIEGTETKIDMHNRAPSIYFLKVGKINPASQKDIKTFKIVKN